MPLGPRSVRAQQGVGGVGQRGTAGEGHGHLQLVAQQPQHMGHAGGPGIGQAPHGGAAYQHGRCTQRNGFEHVGAAPYAAIHQHRHRAPHGLHHAPTWDDITWLQSITRLPVLLKGVLHPADARQAVSVGAAGLIVSNHGGRTLDTAPATASALPRAVQAVGGAVPVLVDGGIRRGTDILKAMALGASAVLVGRPAVWGLANAGAAGVAHVLRLLRDELEIAMALTGCATLADASPALLTADSPAADSL